MPCKSEKRKFLDEIDDAIEFAKVRTLCSQIHELTTEDDEEDQYIFNMHYPATYLCELRHPMEVGSLRYIVKDTAVEESINLWRSLEELKEKVENKSAHSKIASDLGVTHGSTFTMMERVIEAILSLEPGYLRWPNSNRRHKLAQDIDNPIPGCIGYIDGTEIPSLQT
ncbi:hypothetical protein TRICI_005061 [Trichomonascus ciferrii]|uniref:Uncharacterized protein n=1 Tax=Trichomonascus ciferrii TaxID=44093 RepID=A0A642UWN5_9ASCO|nr:hypothetical protein TRICI_005061 [Trichomonascus ciferrii]